MAIVDLNNNKIYGCDIYSRTYQHEKGHIEFNNTEAGVKINYYAQFFQMIAVFFISLGVVTNNLYIKVFGFVNAFGMLACYAYEEIWCWVYAIKNYKNHLQK